MSLLIIALVAFAYAAPPIAPEVPEEEEAVAKPLNLGGCKDGVNNVIKVADINDPNLAIHAKDVVIHTYFNDGTPSCYWGRAYVSLPGKLKIVKGSVVVDKEVKDLKKAVAKMTVRKNSWFIGTVCYDGVSQKYQVPGNVCSRNIYPDIGDDFLKMLSTPGTYNFEEITKKAKVSNVISLPSVSSSLKTFVVNGDWQGQIALVLGKQKIAHVKVPSNGDWVYVY
uniref:Protein T05A7.1 n=1 Tax=Haemonchus contortus TaxID=6289 RepID=W6NAV3_HAECO